MDTVDERVDTGTNNSQTNFLAPEKKIKNRYRTQVNFIRHK